MQPTPRSEFKRVSRRPLWIGLLGVVGIMVLLFVPWSSDDPELEKPAPLLPVAEATSPSVVLPPIDFTGEVKERFYPGGQIQSRSMVNSNEVMNGLSQGWYTNGVLQIRETYVDGVSHGLRTKWYSDGTKKSETDIVHGQIHGTFRSWHPDGSLSQDAAFKEGAPHGESLAYFPSGFLKAEVTLNEGEVVEQQFWKDGERPAGVLLDSSASPVP